MLVKTLLLPIQEHPTNAFPQKEFGALLQCHKLADNGTTYASPAKKKLHWKRPRTMVKEQQDSRPVRFTLCLLKNRACVWPHLPVNLEPRALTTGRPREVRYPLKCTDQLLHVGGRGNIRPCDTAAFSKGVHILLECARPGFGRMACRQEAEQ